MSGAFICHARHSRHVSMISGIRSSADCGTPAACSMFVISVRVARHQRRCSFRNSRLNWVSSPLRRRRRLRVMSNWVQSSMFWPAARSITLGGRLRGPLSGPRPRPSMPSAATRGWRGARAMSEGSGGGTEPEALLEDPPSTTGGISTSSRGLFVLGLTVVPASPAVGSADARIRGSRGCRSAMRL